MQFADLLSRVSYLPPKDIEVLSRAYDAAASAHHDQNRLSGEKFIEHPLSVAAILADLWRRSPSTLRSRRRPKTSARCSWPWRRTSGSCS
jgi:(p)ppGpp synthase/HD superfamily hydrolase